MGTARKAAISNTCNPNNSLLRSLTRNVYKIPPFHHTSTTSSTCSATAIIAHHIALIAVFFLFNSIFCVGDANDVLRIDGWGDVDLGLDVTERPGVVQSLGEQVNDATGRQSRMMPRRADGLSEWWKRNACSRCVVCDVRGCRVVNAGTFRQTTYQHMQYMYNKLKQRYVMCETTLTSPSVFFFEASIEVSTERNLGGKF